MLFIPKHLTYTKNDIFIPKHLTYTKNDSSKYSIYNIIYQMMFKYTIASCASLQYTSASSIIQKYTVASCNMLKYTIAFLCYAAIYNCLLCYAEKDTWLVRDNARHNIFCI